MNNRVVNLKSFGFPRGSLPSDVARIDRRSEYGNPFLIGHSLGSVRKLTREQVIDLYRVWIARKLVADPAFLEPLRSKRLACWCAPLACHGDVIAELIP